MLSAAVFLACHGHHAGGVEVASGAFCREAKKCLFVVYNYIIRWFFRTFALCISIIKNTDINIGTQKNIGLRDFQAFQARAGSDCPVHAGVPAPGRISAFVYG